VNAGNDRRLCERQQIIVALLVAGMAVKPMTVVGVRIQPMRLDHGAHGAIQDQDAFREQAVKKSGAVVRHINKKPGRVRGRVLLTPRALATFVKRPQAAIKLAQLMKD
jgi:hypothetical protein